MAIEHFSLNSLIPPLFEDRPNHRLGQVILLCIKLNCRHRCALPEHDLAKRWWTAVAKNSGTPKNDKHGMLEYSQVPNWWSHCGQLVPQFCAIPHSLWQAQPSFPLFTTLPELPTYGIVCESMTRLHSRASFRTDRMGTPIIIPTGPPNEAKVVDGQQDPNLNRLQLLRTKLQGCTRIHYWCHYVSVISRKSLGDWAHGWVYLHLRICLD